MVSKSRTVGGDCASKMNDRCCPTHDLFDRAWGVALKIAEPNLALLGMFGESHQPVADGIAGGFVASGAQQYKKRRQLLVAEPLAVDLGMEQSGSEVIGGFVGAEGRQLGHDPSQRRSRMQEGL